ncbi:hypothetical protein, partial [Enterobacter sp.]|uniref:hypothetical protein n=1 Tax=Enterobacter sp. TaxID=42895 RepID=UPI003A8F1C03
NTHPNYSFNNLLHITLLSRKNVPRKRNFLKMPKERPGLPGKTSSASCRFLAFHPPGISFSLHHLRRQAAILYEF